MSIFKLPAIVPMIGTALVFEFLKVMVITLALVTYLLESDFFTRNLASLFVDTEEVILFCILLSIVLSFAALLTFVFWFMLLRFKIGWISTFVWFVLSLLLPFMIVCWILNTAVLTVARDAKKVLPISSKKQRGKRHTPITVKHQQRRGSVPQAGNKRRNTTPSRYDWNALTEPESEEV